MSATYRNLLLGLTLVLPSFAYAGANSTPVLPPTPPEVSTIPANGDLNPYGVAIAPLTTPAGGVLQPGDILVSNFNNSANLQGTGTTIVRVDRHGVVTTFFQGLPGLGLTGALRVLSNGMVLVGSMPTTDGTPATVQPGSLLVIDANGHLVAALAEPTQINGPWGMAIDDRGNGSAYVFVANVLTGTITRFFVNYTATSFVFEHGGHIARGLTHRTDPGAIALGPSGMLYNKQTSTLYFASSTDNAIYAISDPETGAPGAPSVVFADAAHLHGPLDIARLPNGNLLVANSDGSNADAGQPSELVEFTTAGAFVGQFSVDASLGGAFGLKTLGFGNGSALIAATDDVTSTLKTWTVRGQ